MLRRLTLCLTLMLVGAALASCGGTPSSVTPASASPEDVARRYVELLSSGDVQKARALVWRPERFGDPTTFGDAFEGATDLRVSASAPDSAAAGGPPEYAELEELRELAVDLITTRRDAAGNPPGERRVFVLLGRETLGGPWRVVDLGTGP